MKYVLWHCGMLLWLLLTTGIANAQLTACNQCTSSDIKINRVYLADASGNPLPSTCTPNTTVSAQICVDFSVTAQTRYGFYFGVDYKVGATSYTFTQCYVETLSQGVFTKCFPISYRCGESVSLVSALLAWGNQQNDLNTFCRASNITCSAFSPKCFSSTNLPSVEAPLIANFTNSAACVTGNTVQTITFNGSATGGTAPYSYSWDLDGNGTFETSGPNPVFTYSSAGTYTVTFKVTDSAGITDTQTYSVTAQTCSLPVTYVYFRAQPHSEGIQLEWQTSAQFEHAYFEVEKSMNAIDFKAISDKVTEPVNEQGSRRLYRYVDARKLTGTVYYRLKQVDVGGQYSYSKIIAIVGDFQATVNVFPNPVGDQLTIQLDAEETGLVDIALYDVLGKRWAGTTSSKTDRALQETLSTAILPKGQYMVAVRVGDHYFIRKLIK